MKLEYDKGTLRVENAEGRRWQLANAEKPCFSFEYDALSVTNEHALRRAGPNVHPLAHSEVEEVTAFIRQLQPPPWATFQKQITTDLRAFAYGLMNSVMAQMQYDGLLDVMITGREGSTDLHAESARRVLAYVDSVWNAFYGLAAQIASTPEAELKSLKEYANMLPAPPPLECFADESRRALETPKSPAKNVPPAAPAAAARTVSPASRKVSVEVATPEAADLSNILDRALVFDDLFSSAQLLELERWALTTPHWMLTNSARDEQGRPQHRIWGASYIQTWQRNGWPGLPPILFSALATICQRLKVTFVTPEYIGLNGQSRGQDASTHVDCVRDATDQLSILAYIGEDTDGDLHLFDKDDPQRMLDRIAFQPNRIVAMDGSVPHRALAPSDDKFRMSIIIRGTYECRRPG